MRALDFDPGMTAATRSPLHGRHLVTDPRDRLRAVVGFASLLLVLLTPPGLTAAVDAARAEPSVQRSERDRALDLESFDWIWTTIRDRHYDPALGGLDWTAVRDSLRPRVEAAESRAAARAAMRRMITLLGESHFQVIPASVLAALGQSPGPGAPDGTTGMDVRVVGGRALVTAVAPGSPADSLGVRPGWEIVRVKDEDLAPLISEVAEASRDLVWAELDLASVVLSRITGSVGDRGVVRFRDGRGQPVDLELWLVPRECWRSRYGPIPNMCVRFESRRLPGDVGYMRFDQFLDPGRLVPAYEAALQAFADCRGLVIDLRGNQGGMIPIAMGMAGWLVADQGLYLGTFRFRDAELKAIVNARLEPYRGPLAVLVDGLSISCAEAFAGGLQDLGRARIFGTRSAGMVLASAIEKLPNGDAFQYVFGSYRSASGGLLEGHGVVPDVEAPPTREALLRGEDAALAAAVRWIRAQHPLPAANRAPAASNPHPVVSGHEDHQRREP